MAATDLQAVIGGLAKQRVIDPSRIQITARGSGDLAVAALFAMVCDKRIAVADLDFANACFGKRNLRVVPSILLYGDILRWAGAVADRRLRLRNVPPEAGDANWLREIFSKAGNSDGLEILP